MLEQRMTSQQLKRLVAALLEDLPVEHLGNEMHPLFFNLVLQEYTWQFKRLSQIFSSSLMSRCFSFSTLFGFQFSTSDSLYSHMYNSFLFLWLFPSSFLLGCDCSKLLGQARKLYSDSLVSVFEVMRRDLHGE